MPNSTAIPCMQYRDAAAAIAWLCDVFGFARQLVVPGPGNSIMHSQLVLAGGMIMVSSFVESEFGQWTAQPNEIGGRETQTTCLIVANADVIFGRAKAAGAQLLMDIKDQDYGGRSFTCRDPQGHIWHVGTYDPWAKV